MQKIFNIVKINLTSISNTEVIEDVPCGDCTTCCELLAPYLTPEEISSGKYPLSLTQPTVDDRLQNKDCGPIITLYKNPTTGGCGMLIDKRCSIYEYRPIACRQFDCRKGHHPKIPNMVKE